VGELENLRAFDQRRVLHAIETRLTHEPTKATKNRKCLVSLNPEFEHVPPVWEIRVGDLRVFYDVEEKAEQVNIRAIRRKSKGQTTKEIT